MGLPPVATYTQHTVHLSTSEPFLHTYQRWNSMGRSKLSHWVKGRNILLKRNRLIIVSAAPATICPSCAIKGLYQAIDKSRKQIMLQSCIEIKDFQYLIKTPFGIFYKTDVLNQTATYREGNARHTPHTDCQRTANCTLHSFSSLYTLGNVTFSKPNRFSHTVQTQTWM